MTQKNTVQNTQIFLITFYSSVKKLMTTGGANEVELWAGQMITFFFPIPYQLSDPWSLPYGEDIFLVHMVTRWWIKPL